MVDDRRDMKGDGGTCVARQGEERRRRVSFSPRVNWWCPHIHMQYSTHRLYLLKRKKKETASCSHGDLHKVSSSLLIIFSSFSSFSFFSSFSLPSPLVVFLLMFPSPPRELTCKYLERSLH